MPALLCHIYRSRRKEGVYLYLPKSTAFSSLPKDLQTLFGKPELALTLLLTPEKPLARANAAKVLADIAEKGFYLQLPPPQDPSMAAINIHNTKLMP